MKWRMEWKNEDPKKDINGKKKFLDAGIQDVSTSISIMYKIEEMSHEKEMLMKVTNIYKHEIVDIHA